MLSGRQPCSSRRVIANVKLTTGRSFACRLIGSFELLLFLTEKDKSCNFPSFGQPLRNSASIRVASRAADDHGDETWSGAGSFVTRIDLPFRASTYISGTINNTRRSRLSTQHIRMYARARNARRKFPVVD